MKAVILQKPGVAGHLKIKKVDEPKIKRDEVLIKHTAIGINFFDVAYRNGQYKLPEYPAILGMEACGIIEKVGSGVKNFQSGERVAYATGGIGAYAEKRAIKAHHLVIPPQELTDEVVAGSLFKGLTAHALLHRVFIATRAKKVLIHAAAGGVGHILCQWAKHLGLDVTGVVSSEEKAAFAQANGCDHLINSSTQDIVKEVATITDHGGVGLVYDSVGKDTLKKSLECLWPMGMCVSFGESSGEYKDFDLNQLAANSLYITRPTMMLYKANRAELALSADEVFGAIQKGVIKPKINTYDFKDVVKAHKELENRKTMGSLVLTL